MEARGVPFGLRSWHQLERLLRPVGGLQKIVYNGLKLGDPNCLCLDVEMEADSAVPSRITMVEGPGTGTKISLAALPPPPPMHQPTSCPQSASGSDNTVPRTQSSDTEKKQLEQQLVGSPRPSQAPRSPKTPPSYPEIVDDTTVQPEMESFQTPDTVAVIQGDGHQNSLFVPTLVATPATTAIATGSS